MLEKAKKDVRLWVEVLKRYGFDSSEESWEINTNADKDIPNSVYVSYKGTVNKSLEQLRDLKKRLKKEYPDIEDIPETEENDVSWDKFIKTTKCCLDYDKFSDPRTEAGLCLWIFTYDEGSCFGYGVCMTNFW